MTIGEKELAKLLPRANFALPAGPIEDVEEPVDFREILSNIYRPGKKEMVQPPSEDP